MFIDVRIYDEDPDHLYFAVVPDEDDTDEDIIKMVKVNGESKMPLLKLYELLDELPTKELDEYL